MSCLKAGVITLLLVLLWSGIGLAIMVSPVVIDAHAVELNDQFTITLTNPKTQSYRVELEWGHFILGDDGNVILEQDSSGFSAPDYLAIDAWHYDLDPESSVKVDITVINQDFLSISPVLYIKFNDGQISSRLAVLFVLSTFNPTQKLEVELLTANQKELRLRVFNPNNCHATFSGQAELYRKEELVEIAGIRSHLILANSYRELSLVQNVTPDLIIIRGDLIQTRMSLE